MYEICQANGQLFTSFSSMEESSMDNDQRQISRIYLEYSKLLSTISQVRHKCLDIKDDELGTYFVTFRKDMHTVDSMILDDHDRASKRGSMKRIQKSVNHPRWI